MTSKIRNHSTEIHRTDREGRSVCHLRDGPGAAELLGTLVSDYMRHSKAEHRQVVERKTPTVHVKLGHRS